MINTKIRFVLFWSAILISSGVRSDANDVVFRSLTSPSEKVRFLEIQRLRSDRDRLRTKLGSVAEAVVDNGQNTLLSQPLRASTVSIVDLIGGVRNEQSQEILVGLLADSNMEVSMLAVTALGSHGYDQAIDSLASLVQGEYYAANYAFRFNLVRSLIEMEQPDSHELLVEIIQDLDGQLHYHAKTFLEDLSIDDFDGDSVRFQDFEVALEQALDPNVKEVKEDQSVGDGKKAAGGFFKDSSEEPESLARMRLQPQRYYGIDIHAKRMLFILDNSSSMKDAWSGMTRLQRAKAELIKAIRELPGDVEFGVVAFNTKVYFWKSDLVEATVDNKSLAISFVQYLGYGNRTNTYSALRTALNFDSRLEAVYLLTDGKPTIGELVSHRAILNDILHRNRFRHLNLNTIGIAVDGFTRDFLQQLAAGSGGEFRQSR
jgi:hypothetical protein